MINHKTTRRSVLAALAVTALPGSLAFGQQMPEITDMRMGNELAPVQVTEYASFTCSHCATFHEDTFGQLKTNYIDTGKIDFVYREVFFDRYGLWAAMMARCEPDKYFGIADILYKRQAEWSRSDQPVENIAAMRKIGLLSGLTNEQLDKCFEDQKMAEALVAHFQKTTTADQVTSTPTLFVNGTKYPNMSYEKLAAIIDTELGG